MPHVIIQPAGEQVAVANIFCIGRNYAAHAAELGNRPEETPMVFLKPNSALLRAPGEIRLPAVSKDVHYETELVVLLGKGGANIAEADALSHVRGYGIGLDLTARDLQNVAKSRGLPWTLAKGFDHAACISDFLPAAAIADPCHTGFSMSLNGETRQSGRTDMMLFSVPYIVHYLSTIFTLQPGDLIYTGTPEGVGQLNPGDRISLDLAGKLGAEFTVG